VRNHFNGSDIIAASRLMSSKGNRTVFATFLSIFVCAISLLASPQKDQVESVQDSEEYAVLSALLNAKYSSSEIQRFVITVDTSSATKQAFIGYRAGITFSGRKRPETSPDLAADFDAKNKVSYRLENHFTLKVPYVLVTSDELHGFFFPLKEDSQPDMESWPHFYQKYPGAPGILTFSRVGFNDKKDQALLYCAYQRGLLGGGGRFFVLSKINGSWEIKNEVIVWLS
jgi:hypothetical protein